VHKTANILDKMPKSIQLKAKSMIHKMYMAPSKEAAKTWKRLKGHHLILLVFENKKFVDGELVEESVA
jgi:hypothetical protein